MRAARRGDILALPTRRRLELALEHFRGGKDIRTSLDLASVSTSVWAREINLGETSAVALAAAVETRGQVPELPLATRGPYRPKTIPVRTDPPAHLFPKRTDESGKSINPGNVAARKTAGTVCIGSLPEGGACGRLLGERDAPRNSPLCWRCRGRAACFFYHVHALPYCEGKGSGTLPVPSIIRRAEESAERESE